MARAEARVPAQGLPERHLLRRCAGEFWEKWVYGLYGLRVCCRGVEGVFRASWRSRTVSGASGVGACSTSLGLPLVAASLLGHRNLSPVSSGDSKFHVARSEAFMKNLLCFPQKVKRPEAPKAPKHPINPAGLNPKP